jgi:uncharacterized protein YacL
MSIAKTFKIDAAMLLFFIITIVSGVEFHVLHHSANHNALRLWYILHMAGSGIFFILAVWHIKLHWGWYKGLVKPSKKRRHPTIILSVLFIVESVTAVLKLVGMHHPIGKIHWVGGLLFTIFAIAHLIRRFRIFTNGLKG